MTTPTTGPAGRRRWNWYPLYVWAALIGIVVWLAVLLLTPLTGYWPKSIRLAFDTARRHADEHCRTGGERQ